MSLEVNSSIRADYQSITNVKNVKGTKTDKKLSPTHKCFDSKDSFATSFGKGGCVMPTWEPGDFEDIFSNKQVKEAKVQVKNILNSNNKGEMADNIKSFYQNISTMDRSELLDVANFLNEMVKENPKNADLLTSLMGGVIEELKQKEDTWHKLPGGKIPDPSFPLPKGPGSKGQIFEKIPSLKPFPNEKHPFMDSFPNEKLPFDMIKPKFDYPPGDYPINKKQNFEYA